MDPVRETAIVTALKDLAADPERFWSKVDKTGTCWQWTRYVESDGYGKFWVGPRRVGQMVGAHRVAVFLATGEWMPKGMDVDHLCRNHGCVRPDHLEIVTHRENNRRGVAGQVNGARQRAITHCPQGHPYDDGNTRLRKADQWGGAHRKCRECWRLYMERYRARTASKKR